MAASLGSRHPRWRGGLTMDPRGYPKIMVGRQHPLADVYGYAYLHHLVLAAAGVEVKRSDARHHINGDKTDCRLENLAVVDHAEHSRQHAETQPRERGRFARRAAEAVTEAMMATSGGGMP